MCHVPSFAHKSIVDHILHCRERGGGGGRGGVLVMDKRRSREGERQRLHGDAAPANSRRGTVTRLFLSSPSPAALRKPQELLETASTVQCLPCKLCAPKVTSLGAQFTKVGAQVNKMGTETKYRDQQQLTLTIKNRYIWLLPFLFSLSDE